MKVIMNHCLLKDLGLGDVFRMPDGGELFMKTENVLLGEKLLLPNGEYTNRINVVNIATGIMLYLDDDFVVVKEKGVFCSKECRGENCGT